MVRLISNRWGISYPNPTGRPDSADVPLDVGSVVAALESIGAQYVQGTLAARPAATKGGRFYVATDLSPHVVYYDNGSSWDQVSNIGHEATHLAGGSDAIPWTTIHGSGLLAARPVAASTNAGYTYFATDVNGGTGYRSDGAAWTQTTFGISAAPAAHEASHLPGGSDALPWTSVNGSGLLSARPAAVAGNAGYLYFATDTGEWSKSTGAVWTQLIRPLLTLAQFAALAPYDGMEVYVQVDAANGINWHVRYDSASASAYKWEVLGGPPLMAQVDTSEVRSVNAYGDMATPGPSVTLPLGGDYVVRHGAIETGGGSGTGLMSFDIGATGAVDADALQGGASDNQANTHATSRLKTGLTAVTLAVKYKSVSGNNTFAKRWIEAIPRRVGQS